MSGGRHFPRSQSVGFAVQCQLIGQQRTSCVSRGTDAPFWGDLFSWELSGALLRQLQASTPSLKLQVVMVKGEGVGRTEQALGHVVVPLKGVRCLPPAEPVTPHSRSRAAGHCRCSMPFLSRHGTRSSRAAAATPSSALAVTPTLRRLASSPASCPRFRGPASPPRPTPARPLAPALLIWLPQGATRGSLRRWSVRTGRPMRRSRRAVRAPQWSEQRPRAYPHPGVRLFTAADLRPFKRRLPTCPRIPKGSTHLMRALGRPRGRSSSPSDSGRSSAPRITATTERGGRASMGRKGRAATL